MALNIRLARPTDGERVAGLLDSLRAEAGYTGETRIPLPADHAGPLFVLLAERDEDGVGLVSAQRCHSLVRGTQFLLVMDVYVVEASRRQGIALALLNEAMALGRRQGCDRVALLLADINNAAVLATAARAGFHRENDVFHVRELD